MDRALDDIVSDRQRSGSGYRGQQRDRRPPRDGVRKTNREDNRNLDREWIHDRYEDSEEYGRPVRGSSSRQQRGGRRTSPFSAEASGARLRVENLHYDITEDDLRELFSRIGPISKVQLLYDRHDRSEGVAFVTYEDVRDAKDAIADFNGANAHGQPIRLSLLPSTRPARNPFDTAERPARSLFDRIESNGRRGRSASPDRERERGPRRSDMRRPAPENIDRYVPGEDSGRDDNRRGSRRSPTRRGRGERGGRRGDRTGGDRDSRRPGERRREPRTDEEGRPMVGGRPRKTAEELDDEMNDYWGNKTAEAAPLNGQQEQPAAQTTAPLDDDIDMIE